MTNPVIEIALDYIIVGAVWYIYLLHQDRVEGSWHEYVLHGLMWPLDLACWIEQIARRLRAPH